jgi:Tfp pilus assembly protein PilF
LLQELIAHADDPGALRQAASLAGRDKRNPAAQFTLGLLAQRQRDLPLAARAMGQAVELDSRPTVRDAYGRLLREMGRLPESERQLRLALETPGPYTTRLRANLAETLLASGRSEEARKLVTEALQVDPSNAQALELRRRLVLERLNQ